MFHHKTVFKDILRPLCFCVMSIRFENLNITVFGDATTRFRSIRVRATHLVVLVNMIFTILIVALEAPRSAITQLNKTITITTSGSVALSYHTPVFIPRVFYNCWCELTSGWFYHI